MSASHETNQAIWNGTVLAESGQTVQFESNQYGPPDRINPD